MKQVNYLAYCLEQNTYSRAVTAATIISARECGRTAVQALRRVFQMFPFLSCHFKVPKQWLPWPPTFTGSLFILNYKSQVLGENEKEEANCRLEKAAYPRHLLLP